MRIAVFALLLLLTISSCYKPKSEGKPLGSADNALTMAFVPSVEAQKVLDSGEQLAALLGEKTGLTIKPLQATSYVGIVEAMSTGDVQVAWLPPMAYVFANQRNGAKVILKVVRHGSPTYRGQIVVRTDSPIKSIADLKGKKIAFPDQQSASGHLYPSALMLSKGIDPEKDCTVVYAGSHDAALTALLKKSVDAACTFDDARSGIKEAFPDVMEATRVLEKTTDIPADCVAVSPSLDPAIAQKISDGLSALAGDEQGKKILFELYEIEGLVPGQDSDYQPVRDMAQQLGLDVEKEIK
jgi:phosphonate transport system substrate-binding protein